MINVEALKIILLESDIMAFSKALSDYHIEDQDNFGNTILHYYIIHAEELSFDYKEVIDLILSKHLDINQKQLKGNFRRCPLHLALVMKLRDIATYLIALGADVNSTDGYGNSILSTAVMGYRNEDDCFVQKLIDCGADIHHKNNYGISPIQLAYSIANYDVKKFFPSLE